MTSLPLRSPDDDLIPLLQGASSDDVSVLVGFIRKANLCQLPAHVEPDDVSAEIQKFGGNTIINMFRGGLGVGYREIVRDVAGKLGISYNASTPVVTIEGQIQIKVLEKAYEKMTAEERAALLDEIGADHAGGIPNALPVIAIQAAIRLGGFAAYRIALIVANAVARQILGQGLRLAANAGISRALGALAGPIGWAVTVIWTLFDIAGPAYRVTIPCVLQVAYIRQKSVVVPCGKCGQINSHDAKFCQWCGAKL